MAYQDRAHDLRASLLRELEVATRQSQLDSRGRQLWLFGELENFLDRWLAFAAIESIPIGSLLNDDLFAMVLVAADVCDQQIGGGAPGAAEWRHFYSELSRIRTGKDRRVFLGLHDALRSVRAAIDEESK